MSLNGASAPQQQQRRMPTWLASGISLPPMHATVRLDEGDRRASALTPSSSSIATPTPPITTPTKKPVRDSKRRATHSQIERRRREKINDRLVTLRTIVPACAAEVEERKRIRRQEEEEARRVAAGEIAATSVRGNGKRKRNRRRAAAAAKRETEGGDDKEEELGLHKLEVLTHTIDYIYELQAYIEELQTGVKPQRKRIEEGDAEAVTAAQRENGDDDDDDDDEGSEAHLEMAEWKGIAKRRAGPATTEPVSMTSMRPAVTRRSTMSSDASSSVLASPALLGKNGLEDASPMFSATASTSALSNYTALTSPMMSLSAESPILRWNKNGGSGSGGSSSSTHGQGPAQNSALPSPRSSREADAAKSLRRSTDVGAADWQMLPAPALSMDVDSSDNMTPTKAGDESDARVATTQQSDAHLLLALSTSPDVFRPTSAVRHTFIPPSSDERRRQSISTVSPPPRNRARSNTLHHRSASTAVRSSAAALSPPPTTPAAPLAFRTKVVGGRSIVLASAPGGAHPSSSSAAQLPSPPLFTLDDGDER